MVNLKYNRGILVILYSGRGGAGNKNLIPVPNPSRVFMKVPIPVSYPNIIFPYPSQTGRVPKFARQLAIPTSNV